MVIVHDFQGVELEIKIEFTTDDDGDIDLLDFKSIIYIKSTIGEKEKKRVDITDFVNDGDLWISLDEEIREYLADKNERI